MVPSDDESYELPYDDEPLAVRLWMDKRLGTNQDPYLSDGKSTTSF